MSESESNQRSTTYIYSSICHIQKLGHKLAISYKKTRKKTHLPIRAVSICFRGLTSLLLSILLRKMRNLNLKLTEKLLPKKI